MSRFRAPPGKKGLSIVGLLTHEGFHWDDSFVDAIYRIKTDVLLAHWWPLTVRKKMSNKAV